MYEERKTLIMAVKSARDETVRNKLLKSLEKAPEGIPGFGRTLMTLGVIVVVGISLFHLLVLSTSFADISFVPSGPQAFQSYNQTMVLAKDLKTQELNIASSILTILGGAVSAIIGFYFGSKSGAPAKQKPADNNA